MLTPSSRRKKLEQMDKMVFIRLDGDRIGDSIELALFNGEYEKAQNIHNSVQQALLLLIETIHAVDTAKVLLRGADDVLFCLNAGNYEASLIECLREIFTLHTSFTLSFGIGDNIQDALVGLHLANYLAET